MLHIATLIFAVFYTMIFIDEAFPLLVNNLGQLCVILLFLFFVIGFVFSWFRERTTGYIFILWYILAALRLRSEGCIEQGKPAQTLGIAFYMVEDAKLKSADRIGPVKNAYPNSKNLSLNMVKG